MAHLQREGRLLRSEHNLLGEAFLVMASSAGSQRQQEVLAWLLEPMSQQWIQIEWQNNYLSEPFGLVCLCSERAFMWSLFHTVTFFEKALKRSGMRKGNYNLQNSSTEIPTPYPIASHLLWMLPPLLKMLRGIHSLWSPSVFQMLPGEIKAAMSMSDVERSSLLGGGNLKSSKGTLTFVDGPQFDVNKEGYTEPNEADIRNWLKGIRDSGYNVLGLFTIIGDPFFKCMDLSPVLWICGRYGSKSYFTHYLFIVSKLRAVHGLVFCTKVGQRSLIIMGFSQGLNASLPSLEHSGHVSRVDTSSLNDLDAFALGSMIGFLLKHKSLAIPMLQISLEAFSWTDREAVAKVCSFSADVVLLAIFMNNADLLEFVSRDLFSAAIRARPRNSLNAPENRIDEGETAGLAAIL
ncbi:protein HASTY 1-like isoform X2 [Hibiscus syriacus]|uniref:Protein HASTY 1-like isoform X2 n=1 Tax=Hibiscus syriacus TaxID=106335 RepID=A0A6A3AU65_HIBSY|nr:protein HASTY 1-like isoform X2 [Hibiscus syriacus]